MKREKVLKEVIEIVGKQMSNTNVTEKTHVVNDLNADSLDTIEMLMWVEDEFMISISDDEAKGIMVVSSAVDLVMDKIHNRGAK